MNKKDKSMLDVIHRNHQEELKQMIEIRNKQQKKEKVLTIFVGVFIVITTILLLSTNKDIEDNALKNCINKGHSENYCLNHI